MRRRCVDTGGVVYVPAPLGIGTPLWDFTAQRLFRLACISSRAEINAVFEGVAHRGADLVDAAESI